MIITKQEVQKILEVMEQFPEAEIFKLEQIGNSGIGSVLTLTISTKINGHCGDFITEISGVENW